MTTGPDPQVSPAMLRAAIKAYGEETQAAMRGERGFDPQPGDVHVAALVAALSPWAALRERITEAVRFQEELSARSYDDAAIYRMRLYISANETVLGWMAELEAGQ